MVLSHYDLGAIESITEFERGSRRSPKVVVVAVGGKFLLKRRAARRKSERKVAFSHRVQELLTAAAFPLPRLIRARNAGPTVVHLLDERYELFEFVDGEAFPATPAASCNAGRALARFHQVVLEIGTPGNVPSGTYHDTIGVRTGLNIIPRSISSHDSVVGQEIDLQSVAEVLFDDYDRAADAVERIGAADSLAVQVVHADWHAGNMLFRDDKVVAVMDYDSCRVAERITDVANGALHFSLISGGHPDRWPDHPDRKRLVAFMRGYQETTPLAEPERQSLTHLMIEALIAESVLPIVHAGSFEQWASFGFLRMVARKVKWFRENEERIRDTTCS